MNIPQKPDLQEGSVRTGRLNGKVAIMFGAGPNIGGTIAYFLAREGAQVAVADANSDAARKTVEFLESRSCSGLALQGNALNEADVSRIVDDTVKRFGHLDIIVNMAGKVHWNSILDMKTEEWSQATLSFPLAALLTTKYAAKAMIAGGRKGSIVHILSTAAHFGEAAGTSYTAAKAATLNLARSAAMDLAHDGIRVNTVTPCGMEHNLWSAMKSEIFDPKFERPKRRSYYSRDDYLKMIPLERFPRASDIAWAAVFLASEESSFLTAVDIPVDGGLRFKYPIWRPGDFTGVNVRDYASNAYLTEYGEPTRKLLD
jgi:NAD(P)-dependent dehydrogenase (short-subunit alcohol dehydrogenase family)